jgi:hypothetical protein
MHHVEHTKIFINQLYSLLFIKELRHISAFISGHHVGALFVVIMHHLSAYNGRVNGCVVYNTESVSFIMGQLTNQVSVEPPVTGMFMNAVFSNNKILHQCFTVLHSNFSLLLSVPNCHSDAMFAVLLGFRMTLKSLPFPVFRQ